MERLHGDWRVVSSGGGLAPSQKFAAHPVSTDMSVFTFDDNDSPVSDLGQGRFGAIKTEYWVHWMDADNTVALIGMPKGKGVWIMKRRNPPQDRIAAAWEIFDWYGYNREWMREAK